MDNMPAENPDDIEMVPVDTLENAVDISHANQQFIQENYRKFDLEQLAIATRLPPEIIAEYLELYEADARRRGIDPNQHFVLSVSLTEDGNVGYGIQFPREEVIKDPATKDAISRLLFLLNDGQLKVSLVKFLQSFADQRKAYTLVNDILTKWGELIQEKEGTNAPIVSPHEVFR
jgi:hypothetical protein